MREIDRRTFVELSTGALLAAATGKALGNSPAPLISSTNNGIEVRAANYSWKYAKASDTFQLRDSRNRMVSTGKLQPVVVFAPIEQPSSRMCLSGALTGMEVEPGQVTFNYTMGSGEARLSSVWRFDGNGIWTDPIAMELAIGHDVVSVHYFCEAAQASCTPSLQATYFIVPGINSGSAISPIVPEALQLDTNVWLGRGSSTPGLSQQWGLPAHYFCGYTLTRIAGERDMYTDGKSDAFACGLADLPGGDLFLKFSGGKCSPWIDYRSDLWKHLRGPGKLKLGATLSWSVALDYYQAIAGYYRALVEAKIVRPNTSSPRKTSIALTPQFCTWGMQTERDKGGTNLDEAFLNDAYEELRSSGMRAGLISIDDKWEGSYGTLTHSVDRLPHFEQFLDRLRADGYRVGLWAALMRCEKPSELGLTEANMLLSPDGKPFQINSQYYILDFTQPLVAAKLAEVARKFIRRYKPDLLKFDFGYELPAAGSAAPLDKSFAGERLLWKGLDVVIKAMREENPDLVVMYYNLSPLLLDYVDLHSPDDLWEAAGEYDLEANRRFFFSSLLAPLGVPTYGSSGYDWESAPNIWFDSAAMGTIGSLNDFRGDERGETGKPESIAKYNGIAKALRAARSFEILPLGAVPEAPSLGAHARSWARFEDKKLVLLAYRPPVFGANEPQTQSSAADSRVKDTLRSNVPVVVASATAESIAKCDRLAMVPYGSGEVVLTRETGTQAELLYHYFGGTKTGSHTLIEKGQLKIRSQERDSAGRPLELIEVLIS